MKRIFGMALIAALFFAACGESDGGDGQQTQDSIPGKQEPADGFYPAPSQVGPVQFSHPRFQFGEVIIGDTVHASWRFKNMSDHPVYIDSVIVSCPCILPDWPRDEIAPGQIREIKADFFTGTQFPAKYEKLLPVMVRGEQIPVTLELHGEVKAAPTGNEIRRVE